MRNYAKNMLTWRPDVLPATAPAAIGPAGRGAGSIAAAGALVRRQLALLLLLLMGPLGTAGCIAAVAAFHGVRLLVRLHDLAPEPLHHQHQDGMSRIVMSAVPKHSLCSNASGCSMLQLSDSST